MTNRLFIAGEIPQNVLDEINSYRSNYFNPEDNIKWESKEKLHITLKYLGDVEVELIPQILINLKNVLIKMKAIDLSISGFGVFSRYGTPRILWMGFSNFDNLISLKSKIDEVCEKLGFKREQTKYNPHITLARLKGKENISKIKTFVNSNNVELGFKLKNILLVRSILKPAGSEYSILKSLELN